MPEHQPRDNSKDRKGEKGKLFAMTPRNLLGTGHSHAASQG